MARKINLFHPYTVELERIRGQKLNDSTDAYWGSACIQHVFSWIGLENVRPDGFGGIKGIELGYGLSPHVLV